MAHHSLFDFSQPGGINIWRAVNDGVMGGVSSGMAGITSTGTLLFSGTISLANNGGFASIRTNSFEFELLPSDSFQVRMRGDGRVYSMNLYIRQQLRAFSYRAMLPSIRNEWTETKLPLGQFVATQFGRPVAGAGRVDPAEIASIGFMLADAKQGPFCLEVESIGVVKANGSP
jgi:monofunctional biosynthetic peptidoglycan transglycosylase